MLKTVSTQLALASDTLPEVLAKGNTTGGTDLAVSSGDDITFADNSKAIFGDGSDISIYSDGTTGQVTGSVNVTGASTFGSTIASVGNITINGSGSYAGFIADSTGATGGGYTSYKQNGITQGTVGVTGSILGTSATGLSYFAETGYGHSWLVNGAASQVMTLDTSGQLSVPAGVLLGGTAAANLLDDYEEGTWTPAYQSATGSVTITSSEGRYVRIGKTVYVTGFISGNSGTGSGNIFIAGLPFTGVATSNYGTGHFAVVPGMTWGYSGATPPAMMFVGNSATSLTLWDSSTNNATVAGWMGAGGATFTFSLTYEAA